MNQLSNLVTLLEQLPNARVGYGPEHPLHPDDTYARSIEQMISEHAQLSRYPDYIEFLRRYAGAALASEQSGDPFLAIYGFGEFDDDVSDVVTKDEFYIFAESYSDSDSGKTTYFAFVLNIADHRKDGVYWANVSDPDATLHEYKCFCATFTQWLDELTARGGVFPA